jgi:hypothetical protein
VAADDHAIGLGVVKKAWVFVAGLFAGLLFLSKLSNPMGRRAG